MAAHPATASAERATDGTERSFGAFPSNVRSMGFIAAKAKELWRNKVAVELAARAGVSVRSAENYLAGGRDMNGNALARLLQSDEGPHFLEAIIANLPPSRQTAWRLAFDKAAKRAALRRELEALDSE